MADPTEPYTDRLIADPFNATGVWQELAAAYRAAGFDDWAKAADTWATADDRTRGELLLVLTGKRWEVASRIAARLLMIAGPLVGKTTMGVVKNALAGHEFLAGEMAAMLAAAGRDGGKPLAN